MEELKTPIVAGGLQWDIFIFILFIIPYAMSSGKLSTFSFQLCWTKKGEKKKETECTFY